MVRFGVGLRRILGGVSCFPNDSLSRYSCSAPSAASGRPERLRGCRPRFPSRVCYGGRVGAHAFRYREAGTTVGLGIGHSLMTFSVG